MLDNVWLVRVRGAMAKVPFVLTVGSSFLP